MPLYVNDLCIGLLRTCNWHCKYCTARADIPIDEECILKEVYPHRHRTAKVWLSGGEPGLLSENFWDEFTRMVELPLRVCTNGTFIKRKLHHKFDHTVAEYMIHCVQDLDEDIDPEVLEFLRTEPKSKVNVVIHRYNTHLIADFLKKYPDLIFELNFTDTTFVYDYNQKTYDYFHNEESLKNAIRQLSEVKNYTRDFPHKLIKCLIKKDFKNLNAWSPENYAKY